MKGHGRRQIAVLPRQVVITVPDYAFCGAREDSSVRRDNFIPMTAENRRGHKGRRGGENIQGYSFDRNVRKEIYGRPFKILRPDVLGDSRGIREGL